MKHSDKHMTTAGSHFSRRDFLKFGALFSGAMILPGSPDASGQGSKERSNASPLFTTDFVPGGALFKLAFVCDHHYWPNHYKNWGSKQFRSTEERMRDLIETLNREQPDVSIHGGDVIDAGSSFVPPFDEYIRQLDYEKEFLNGLSHPAIPIIGNHEVPDDHYEDISELREWGRRFGDPYRYFDIKGWRLVSLNTLAPNPGEKYGKGQAYGIDDEQVKWLKRTLNGAAARKMQVLLFSHIPPDNYKVKNDFESVITSSGCVRGMMCGHNHRNRRFMLGDIPVMVRVSNVSSPLGYTLVYPYPDGRILVVQKSQHFPFIDYQSSLFKEELQGKEEDRYYTLNGSSDLPLDGLAVIGENTVASIRDGHLRLTCENGRGFLLIDRPGLDNVRLTVSAVKEGAVRMGVVAYANDDCSDRVEGVITSEYGPDGNMFLASHRGSRKDTPAISWFNIVDGISYQLIIEARNGAVTFSPKNMPVLSAAVRGNPKGRFGLFVQNGTILVTDIRLEKIR